jgi:hypothetical protein
VSVDPEAGRLIGTTHKDGRSIWYYQTCSTEIDLSRDGRALIARLNAALKAGGVPLAEKLWLGSWWGFKPKAIADLLKLPAKR